MNETLNPNDRSCDVAVIGAGPAGIAAALELRRHHIDVSVISDGPPGGLIRAARRLDNIPGYPGGISGTAWAHNCALQMKKTGLDTVNARATHISRTGIRFTVTTTTRRINADAVILATGTRPRPLPPEIRRSARVLRDLSELPEQTATMTFAVIGGGEAAADSALFLRDHGADVTVFARGGSLKTCTALAAELDAGDVTVVTDAEVQSVRDRETGVEIRFENHADWIGDAAVVAIGREPAHDDIDMKSIGTHGNKSLIQTTPGLFSAGDMNRKQDRYALFAMADGQRAALMACRYLTVRRTK